LIGGADGTARLYDAATGRELKRWQHTNWVSAVAFSPDGDTALSASLNGTAGLCQTKGKQKGPRWLRGHGGSVWAAVFSPDSKTVLTGSADGVARLWDAATGAEVRQFRGHRGAIRAVAFSPDGRLVLTAGLDRTARLWETATRQQLHQL